MSLLCNLHKIHLDQVCLNTQCNCLICRKCQSSNHQQHPTVPLEKLLGLLQNQQQEIENTDEMDKLEDRILKQSVKLGKLSEFVENLKQQLLALPHIGEAEIAYSILEQIEKQQQAMSLDDANLQLNRFLLYLNVNQSELIFSPSKISQIRMKNLLKKKLEFGNQLQEKCDNFEQDFNNRLEDLKDLLNIKDDKEFNERDYEEFKEKIRLEYNENAQLNQKNERHMLKLCHYLIFYTNIQCEDVIKESIKKQKDNKDSLIKCVFCKQIKTERFIQYYHKSDLVERFGQLCKLKNDIYCHEMCLLWSNMVIMDYKSNKVDINSLIRAIEQSQQCNFCNSQGASLKCNKTDCQIWYHFHCIKQIKLKGLQFDQEKYRFLCKNHASTLNSSGRSEWYLNRLRLRRMMYRNGLLIDEPINKKIKSDE